MEGYLGEQDTNIFGRRTQADWAIAWIEMYGGIDGGHHKQWAVDQVQRILLGTKVIVKVASWENGETEFRYNLDEPSQEYLQWVKDYEGDDEYEWDEGIAP
jgi:hypothetical protein